MIRLVQRFEYRIETIALERTKSADEQLTQALNKWGRQGWRVCQVTFRPAAQGSDAEDAAQLLLERRLAHWLLNEEDD
ncbi:MAG: DUF4177 domain-containing protein [Anaerolineae bacterium]|nr:DUF4177 domain-containing protein [Candidatus Roseilinea sp.]MDW8451090.1 DUF4177 domain-containing protein [Anaerolineae bacterium]